MRISGNFPVVSQTGSNARNTLPVIGTADQRGPSGTVAISSVDAFESAFSAYSERFFKIDGLSFQTKEALSAYQETQSLSASNPRNLLIGVDVYA